MSVSQRGNRWQAYVSVDGVRKRKSFGSKDEAMLWETQIRQSLLQGTEIPEAVFKQSERYTFKQAAERCYKMHWVGSKSEDMQAKMIEVIGRELGNKLEVSRITTSVIEDYILRLRDEGKANGTINRRLACLSKILKTCHRSGYLQTLPHIPRQREGQNRLRWLTWEEEEAILDTMYRWGLLKLHDAFVVSIDTGIRISELNKIKPKHILKEGLHVPESKNDSPRVIPLTQRAREVLTRRAKNCTPDERVIGGNKNWHRDQWEKVKDHLGLTDVVWHTLRHTTCSRLIQGGMPLTHVKEWMGHKAIQTTLRYAHLAPQHLDTGLSLLERKSVAQSVA